jgi:hypothetical protein
MYRPYIAILDIRSGERIRLTSGEGAAASVLTNGRTFGVGQTKEAALADAEKWVAFHKMSPGEYRV